MAEYNEVEMNGRINALQLQRNNALDQMVILMGIIASKDDEIKQRDAKIAILEAAIPKDNEGPVASDGNN